MSLLNSDGNFVSGSPFQTTGGARPEPVNVDYTFNATQLADWGVLNKCYICVNLQAENGTLTLTNYHVNTNVGAEDMDEIINKVYEIDNKMSDSVVKTVSQNIDADFPTLENAVASIPSDNSAKYTLMLLDDEYDIYQELGGDTFAQSLSQSESELQGILLPDNVDLIGKDGGTTLRMEIPDEGLENIMFMRTSTLNLNKNNSLKNLIIIGKNVRYAVHDETNNQVSDYIRNVENCKFIHLGVKESERNRWLSQTAYGCGTGSGGRYSFKNCEFIGLNYCGIGMHDNYNFDVPNFIQFDNCKMFGQFDVDSDYRASARFEVLGTDVGSGHNETVIMNNCQLNAPILLRNRDNGFLVSGAGNSRVPYKINGVQEGNQPIFYDETTTIRASESIEHGSPTYAKNGKLYKLTSDDNAQLYAGVLLASVTSDSEAVVKRQGYVRKEDLGIANVNAGDVISIVSGEFAVSNTGKNVGVAEDTVNIRLL